MKIHEFITESKPKIRKVTKTRPDDSEEITYEVIDSEKRTVKTGMSKEVASSYLKNHFSELCKD